MQVSDQLGLAIIMLDVLDCGDADLTERRKALYGGYGFKPLPSNELRLYLPIGTVRQLLDETEH